MAKANIMEYSQNNKNNKANKIKLYPKGEVSKKQTKYQGKCFSCDKIGHKDLEYRLPKKKGNPEANMVENISKDMSDVEC